MPNKAKSPYKGDLAKPIPKKFKGEALDAEFRRRLSLLLEHYDLKWGDPELWLSLAFQLIHDHVPGLQQTSGPGRPKIKGTPERRLLRAELLRAVKAKQSSGGHSDSRACELVKAEWKLGQPAHPWANRSGSFLRGELRQARQIERKLYRLALIRILKNEPPPPGGFFAVGVETIDDAGDVPAYIAGSSEDRSSDS